MFEVRVFKPDINIIRAIKYLLKIYSKEINFFKLIFSIRTLENKRVKSSIVFSKI